jgi:hypothetical protein
MHKRLCACGCGDRVTRKVELQHMNALAPAVLASQVLEQNRRLVRRKKKPTAIGFPTPLRQRLAMRNATEFDNMGLDDNHPVSVKSSETMTMGEDDGPLDQHRRLARRKEKSKATEFDNMDLDDDDPVSHSKSFQNIRHISHVDQNIYIDHEGSSGLTHGDSLSPDPHEDVMDHDHPAPSPLPNDDAGMGENLNGEVYGLSNLRRSRRIADTVEKLRQRRWGSNASVHVVNNREKSDNEEEEDIEDDEPNSDFDVASDESQEGYDDDDDELFAGPGQEGISLWDSLGEGFLREASQLGTSFWYYHFLKF